MAKETFKAKAWEDLDFTDDFIFGKVMHNPEICAELLERLLKIKVDHIEYPELQKSIQPYYTTRGVRLDVYVKDSDRVFDIEMQTYKEEAIGKRMRYYQSMVDLDCLMKGERFTELKESYIIFICTEDPLGYGLPVYTFREKCDEDPTVSLNDKSAKVVYNASAYTKTDDKATYNFLQYVCKRKADDDFTERLKALVGTVKTNEIFRQEYMSMNLHDFDKMREGMRLASLENAKAFLAKSISPQIISECTKLPLEEVLRLAKEISPSVMPH